MSGKEMNSYRFTSGEEPSDEMLRQLMQEVAHEAKQRNHEATDAYLRKCVSKLHEKEKNGQTESTMPSMGERVAKPELIMIAGPNGSGKTSVTQKFLHHEWAKDTLYINPDNVANDLFGDWNSIESVLSSARYCENLRENCLKERKSFVFETVFSAEDKIDFLIRAKQAGFFIRVSLFPRIILRSMPQGLQKGDGGRT